MENSYKELFLSESQEYLGSVNNCLVKLEDNPSDLESINEIFRCMHTLKGMSATMGYDKITQLSHQMENMLDELRSKRRKLNADIIDILFTVVDVLQKLVDDIKLNRETEIDITVYLERIKHLVSSGSDSQQPEQSQQETKSAAKPVTLELSEQEIKKFKELKNQGSNIFQVLITIASDCMMKESRAFLIITNLKKMGEILKSSPPLAELEKGRFQLAFTLILSTRETQNVVRQEIMAISEVDDVAVSVPDLSISASAPVTQAVPSSAYVKKIQSMRIPVERLDKIMNLIGELAIAKIRFTQIVHTLKSDTLEEISFMLGNLVSAIQDELMQTRLLPVAYILDTFPRMVRDMAKKENKEISFEVSGSEIELDRVILDEIGDPLVHLIRNSIDHGIESPEERRKKNKPVVGKISIAVTRQKGQIFIEVEDDGGGVDFEAVKKKALKKGLISAEDADNLDERRVLDIISLPGFSTSEIVTDISGRGVGLDVVKTKIESLGGRLDFETKFGVGSKFILTIPLTLAIIKAMLVKVGEEIFAIPLMAIRETIKINKEEVKFLQDLEVTRVRDEIIPLLRLEKEFAIEIQDPANEANGKKNDDRVSIVIVEYGKRVIGLIVTHVVGEQDIVVKPLGSMIRRTKGIAGATILGDGKVALILDIMSLR